MQSILDYKIISIIGNGSSAIVYKVESIIDNNIYALKVINKSNIKESKIVINENKILQTLDNPFVVKLYYSFEDDINIYFVLEYAENGSLYDILLHNNLSVENIKHYLCELLLGLEYLQTKSVILRDIKLDNILVRKDGHLMYSDFGMANYMSIVRHTVCGTIEYMAPEIIRNKHQSFKTDIWSLGIVIYELLHKHTPFIADNEQNIFYKILTEDPIFINREDELLNSVVELMLTKEISNRPHCSSIKNHQYFKDIDFNDYYYKKILIKNINYIKNDKPNLKIQGFVPYSVQYNDNNNDDNINAVLIDDDKSTLQINQEILKRFNIKNIILFTNVKDSIIYIKNNKNNIDIILLDLIMPEMNGDIFLNKVSDLEIPIILLTGNINTNKTILNNKLLIGYIQKPLRKKELHKNIIMGAIYQRKSKQINNI